MNRLPREIEDDIWQLYWMSEFKDKVLDELISVSSFHEKLQEIDDVIRKNLRYIRFNHFVVYSEIQVDKYSDHYEKLKLELRNDMKVLNDNLEMMFKNKIYIILFPEGILKKRLLKCNKSRMEFTGFLHVSDRSMPYFNGNNSEWICKDNVLKQYYYAIIYFMHNCNFQKKMFKGIEDVLKD